MLKCMLIGLLLLQGPGAEPAKDPQLGRQQTLAQSSPIINSDRPTEPSKDDAFKTEQLRQNRIIVKATIWIAVFGGLSFVAALIYAIVSIKQWKAIDRQAGYAGAQVEKMQGQLDAIKGQETAMRDQLVEMKRQVAASEAQFGIAEVGIKAAEKSAIYAQRAYVVAKIRDVGKGDDTLQFRLRIENSGNTPANDVFVHYAYGIREQPPHEEAPNEPVAYDDGFTETERLGLIAPNGSYHVISTPEVRLEPANYQRWESEQIRFYCWGRIIYEDIFNEKRHSDFCFFQSQGHPEGYPCKHGNDAN